MSIDYLERLYNFRKGEFDFEIQRLGGVHIRLIAYLDGSEIDSTDYSSWKDMIEFAFTGCPRPEIKEIIENGEY